MVQLSSEMALLITGSYCMQIKVFFSEHTSLDFSASSYFLMLIGQDDHQTME
jgi:hypothetical protein